MSGSDEVRERSGENGAAPSSPAPPSFGGNGAPPRDTEREKASDTRREPGSAPLPSLPLPPLQKPWWASSDEDGGEPSPEDGAPAEPPPGALVAGRGAPVVDTRGAVPRVEPVADRSFPDTNPDGIPFMPKAEPTPEPEPEPEPAPVLTPDAYLPPGVTPPADGAQPIPQAQPIPEAPSYPEQPLNGTPPLPFAPVQDPKPNGASATKAAPVTKATPVTKSAPVPETAPPSADDAPTRSDIPAYTEAPAGPSESTAPNSLVPGMRGDTPRFGTGPLSDGPTTRRKPKPRKPLLIGAGAVALLVIGISGFALAGSGSDAKPAAKRPAASGSAKPAKPTPVDINSAKTDPKALTRDEAFPDRRVVLGGRPYVRDRVSVNHRLDLTANGAMLLALKKERAASVVRATYADVGRSLAVTTGIAVLPDRAAAGRVSRAGDPSAYEWFTAMVGKRSPDIDKAGGYALSTIRGRYLVYAYAQYANGKTARAGDTTLKTAAQQVLNHAVKPIEARAAGR